MEKWDKQSQEKVSSWDPKGPPLILIGPSGVGKTKVAENILKDHHIIRYYPSDFRENKDFLVTIKWVLEQKGVLTMMRAGPKRAILIENISQTTASDKSVLEFLASQKTPSCPIIMTAEKTEKRHRDLLRNCYPVRISVESEDTVTSGANGEEISELAFSILRGETFEIPASVSFTERVVLVSTLLENLGDRIPEWYHIITDRTAKRIFDEERWDLIRIINEYIFPIIFNTIKKKPVTKKLFFTHSLSLSSTRTLNRKSIISLTGTSYEDPVKCLIKQAKAGNLPKRFRIKLDL
jgi:DNA polymerase III delta prime subunit